MSIKPESYNPKVKVHPSKTILCVMFDKQISNVDPKITTVIGGGSIDEETAIILEATFGLPKYWWMNLQSNYDKKESDLLEGNN